MNRGEAIESAPIAAAIVRKLTRSDRCLRQVVHRHPTETLAVIEAEGPGVLEDPRLAAALLVELAELAAAATVLATEGSHDPAGPWRTVGQLKADRLGALRVEVA